MKIHYRLIKKEDVDGIFEISSLSFKTPWSYESIKSEINNPLAKYIVALDLDNKKILGFIGAWIIASEADIVNIAVHPKYRSLGIGSKLLSSFIELGRNEDWYKINLEVRESNLSAQKLYSKYNFKVDGIRKNYYEDTKENAILMSHLYN